MLFYELNQLGAEIRCQILEKCVQLLVFCFQLTKNALGEVYELQSGNGQRARLLQLLFDELRYLYEGLYLYPQIIFDVHVERLHHVEVPHHPVEVLVRNVL